MYHRLHHNTAPLDPLGLLGGGEGGGRGVLTNRSSFHLNHHSRTLPFSSKSLEKGHAEKMLLKKPWSQSASVSVTPRTPSKQRSRLKNRASKYCFHVV